MSEHAPLPSLCDACYAEALADAGCLGSIVLRHCEHRGVSAVGYKRGTAAVVAWHLFAVPNDDELKHITPLLAEIWATGQIAMRRKK